MDVGFGGQSLLSTPVCTVPGRYEELMPAESYNTQGTRRSRAECCCQPDGVVAAAVVRSYCFPLSSSGLSPAWACSPPSSSTSRPAGPAGTVGGRKGELALPFTAFTFRLPSPGTI